MTQTKTLDLIAIGRSSVDLYGQQVGGRLEDMASFSKAVGGSPTNIAIGTSRLGLKSGLITRVGDEHMGRFIREQLQREGVDVSGVQTDKTRLTALVLLGIRDDKSFPLIFYRSDCADAALDESDISESYIASTKSIVITGTHFAKAHNAAAQKRAMKFAKKHGAKIAFDIDYRPNLWGLAGHDAGEERYIKSGDVTAHLAPILGECDLIVGTEEEVMIAGGEDTPLAALRAIRQKSNALIVMKRGPMGCVVFPEAIPDDIEKGLKGPGFPVEVYNVLGAGDAFMSGFLRGWLRDEPLETCCSYANAGGAFAVSRLLCSAEYATFTEMQHFIKQGAQTPAVRHDTALTHLHWATTRDAATSYTKADHIFALAIDHRAQLEKIADDAGAPRDHIKTFKTLALEAALSVAKGRKGFGMLLDDSYGRDALFKATGHNLWIGRPVEAPGSRPLDFEGGGSLAAKLIEWPVNHIIKCLCFYHPDDPADLKEKQDRELVRLHDAARKLGRELLIEIICGKHGELKDDTTASIMDHLYQLKIKPDWWKLEAQPSSHAWTKIEQTITTHDPLCRGIMMLGLDAPESHLINAFSIAKPHKLVKGFAIGRTIFAEPAKQWLSNSMTDAEAIDAMARSFSRLVSAWEKI